MNCQEARERLPGLIDGELAPEERAEVEKHLEECEECRAEKHRQEQFTTRVKTSLEDLRPSALFVKGVLDKLGDPEKKKKEQAAAARRTKISLIAAGAVIVVVLIAAWIHAMATKADGKPTAATVTGQRKAWMMVQVAGGWKRRELLANLAAGVKVETGPGGRVEMELQGENQLLLHEKSLVRFEKAQGGTLVVYLEKGALTFARSGEHAQVDILGAKIVPEPGCRFKAGLQYGTIVVLIVKSGSATMARWGRGTPVTAKAGETWTVLPDGSEPPEKLEEKP